MKLKLTVEKIETENIYLKTEIGQTISWPAALLPKEIELGQTLSFEITADGELGQDGKLAKDILNEILNSEN